MAFLNKSAVEAHQDAVTARLVFHAAWVVALVASAIAVLLALDSEDRRLHVSLHLLIALAGLVTLVLLRFKRPLQAASVFVWAMWCMVALVTANNGGIRAPSLLNFPVLIVFSGWLLGERATKWLTALTGLLMLVFIWGQDKAWFGEPNFSTPLAHVAYLSGLLVLTAVATLMSRRGYLGLVRRTREAAQALAERETDLRKFRLAVEQSPIAIVITDTHDRIDHVNTAFERISGFSRDEALGKRPLDLSPLASLADAAVRDALAQGQTWTGERSAERKDGSHYTEFAIVAPIRQADGHISHYMSLKQDISEQKQAEQRIHRLTHYSDLTGLPNRIQLQEHMTLSFAIAARHARCDALLLFNIDRFQNVNNARGQEVGDQLLCAVARRLSDTLRAGDVLAHLSADEFAVLLHNLGDDPGAASRMALTVAEKIQQQLLAPLHLAPETHPGADDDEGMSVTASLGVALCPLDANDTPTEALRRAHTALRRAKDGGGHQTAFFDTQMGKAAEERFHLERALRHAVAGNELRLYLQSQVDAQGQVTGAEALLRWQHPQRGLVPPGVFIALAEESDLIVCLGDWVLREACACMAQARAQGHTLHLSVNLSPRQFNQPGLVTRVKELLHTHGIAPQQLMLEVTEGLVVDDVDAVVEKMHTLTALGVRFSLDDFGTGYSSLRYLKRLPLHEIKIDKSFVQDAPHNKDDAALVETILAVAKLMDLSVVAEGVETQAQADFLGDRKNLTYQGYLYGHPEPSAQWMQNWVQTMQAPAMTPTK